MKRSATILFSLVYLAATSGILMGQHLCMGSVKNSAIFQKVTASCGMGMEMHKEMKGCCDDEWVLKKVEDDQQVTAGNESPKGLYHLLYEVPFNDFVPALIAQGDEVEVHNTGPPDIAAPGLFLLFQSLKIPLARQS